MSAMTYRQLADYVKQRQRLKHRAMTEPEDDFLPEAFFLRGILHTLPIPVRWFENRATKARLFYDVIPMLIRAGGVRAFALTNVMYLLPPEHPMAQVIAERHEANPDESPTKGLPRFQDIEGTVEQLWVHVFDAERYEGWQAEIKRPRSGPPKLAPFEMSFGPDAVFGDLVDPIKAALR